MELQAKRLFFNDGCVFTRNLVFIASQFQEYSGSDISRVSMVKNAFQKKDGDWAYADFDDAALSVACLPSNAAFFMGHNGTILVLNEKGKGVEIVPDVARYGSLTRIRSVRDQVYVCGMSGQVLVRGHDGWFHLDKGLLGTEGLDLEDIDGTGPDDIYAVGLHGAICHYDGVAWRQLDSPTNRPLSNVRCVSKEEVYICGDDGNLFRGNASGWNNLRRPEVNRNFWGMEFFQGNIYVAHARGVMVHNGIELSDVDLGFDGQVGCHRLHANDGVLWSFGIDDLLFFDGSVWRRVFCPMNT